MFLATLILIISVALFFFYIQVTCQRILRRRFDKEYFQAIVSANRLEFLSVRQTLEEFDSSVDYARVRMTLKCDYLALTYLLKHAANFKQRYSRDELLMIFHFRAALFSLLARHALKLKEKPAILRLTAVLQYFANVVGQRVSQIRFGDLSATDYLMNI